MQASPSPLWFLLNLYGWIVFGMSVVTALVVQIWWIVLLGIIGYLLALLFDLVGGGSLGRTGQVRLARIEQENRELRAEQARLLGALQENSGARNQEPAVGNKEATP